MNEDSNDLHFLMISSPAPLQCKNQNISQMLPHSPSDAINAIRLNANNMEFPRTFVMQSQAPRTLLTGCL